MSKEVNLPPHVYQSKTWKGVILCHPLAPSQIGSSVPSPLPFAFLCLGTSHLGLSLMLCQRPLTPYEWCESSP